MVAGCGNSDDSNPESDADVDVTTVLSDASTRIAETQSLKFTLDISGTTMIDDLGTIQLLAARGSLARPDLVDVQFQVRVLGTQTASIRMVTAGGQSWTTDLISGEWGPAPEEFGYDPARLFDTQDGLGPIMGKIDSPELIGTEDVDGKSAWHVRGVATQEVIGPVTANKMHGDTVAVDLWIDTSTSDLLKVQLAEPAAPDVEDPATWVMTLLDHDKPVTIEPPI